ncbi:hypothetical protein LINGRAHAP2_LOCUS36163 [Linum grandiflorum]
MPLPIMDTIGRSASIPFLVSLQVLLAALGLTLLVLFCPRMISVNS